jgi:hypothetical protein
MQVPARLRQQGCAQCEWHDRKEKLKAPWVPELAKKIEPGMQQHK